MPTASCFHSLACKILQVMPTLYSIKVARVGGKELTISRSMAAMSCSSKDPSRASGCKRPNRTSPNLAPHSLSRTCAQDQTFVNNLNQPRHAATHPEGEAIPVRVLPGCVQANCAVCQLAGPNRQVFLPDPAAWRLKHSNDEQ